MIDDEHSGIANILNLPLKAPVRTPKVDTQVTPELTKAELLMSMKPLSLPKTKPEKKDEFGYTQKQNREINNFITRPKILSNNINKKKISAEDYIEKTKKNYNDLGNQRFVNKTLNKFENRTANKNVVTFDPTTQLFTDDTRNIAFKSYNDAKRWNDAVNQEPTATPKQVNDLKGRLDNSRAFGYDPDKKEDVRKSESVQTNKHRRPI